jgi:oxygen-independent coproporphyrinogen-3 oxidase
MLGVQGLQRLVSWVDHKFDRSEAIEFTAEANPEHLDEATVEGIVAAGFDRVSIGMQTFDAGGLVQLGRTHDAGRGREAIERCVGAGLRTSVDLIVGWPGQRPTALQRDLEALVDTGVDHVSIYALTIEAGTPWENLVRRGTRSEPDPELQAVALQQCEATLTAAGLSHYEVASYARGEARAQHNLKYWTWQDYLGLGPSAASATFEADGSVHRMTNPRGLDRWAADPTAAQRESLSPIAAATEGLWTGLRLLEGLDVRRYLDRFAAVDRAWLRARVQPQQARGNVVWSADGNRLAVAPGRWLFHDEICADLM